MADGTDDNSPTISTGELKYLAGVHGRLLERLVAKDALSVEELSAGKRLVTYINREVQRRVIAPSLSPREALWPAIANWDLLNVDVQKSHRGMVGRLVTGTKRALVGGMRPLHVELLAPQRAFNQKLLDSIVWILDGRYPSGIGLSSFVRSSLQDLQRSISALKPKGATAVFAKLIAPANERQREWNERATALVFLLLEDEARTPTPKVHDMLGELMRLSSFPLPSELEGAARVSFPVWVELFRKQQAYNQSITRTITSLFGLPLRGDDGRAWYPVSILGHEERRAEFVKSQVQNLDYSPLISIITPTWRANRRYLTECIDSVLAQSYQRWELCLVDDGSPDPETQHFVQSFAERDPRIRVKHLARNSGIALATNEALSMATGDFVAFLDHDDTIASHALGEVALHLAKHPTTDVLYTDEDRLDVANRRNLPFFKPDWSPDLLRAVNYVCHFLVVRRKLIEEVGRIRTGYDGAQDFDLVLRLSEKTNTIGHISEVLYHWRAAGESTALNLNNKPAAATAGIRALAEHLHRCGQAGVISSPIPTHYQVKYETPQASVKLVVASSKVERLKKELEATRYRDFELCVVSHDARGTSARRIPWHGAQDLGAMYELARKSLTAEVFVFLHEDVSIVDPDWLTELVAQAMRSEIGVVGPKLVNPDSTIQDAGWVVGEDGALIRPFENMADTGEWTTMGIANWTRNYRAVSPACFAVRSSVLEQVGGFRPNMKAAETVLDLCTRISAAGMRVLFTPHSRVLHFAKTPRGDEAVHEVHLGLGDPRQIDPFFNPHLSPRHTNGAPRLFDSLEKPRW